MQIENRKDVLDLTVEMSQGIKDKLQIIRGYLSDRTDKKEMNAEAGHEVKNLLNIIYGHSDLMKIYLEEENFSGLKKSLDHIDNGIQRLNIFTNKLMGRDSEEKNIEDIELISFLNSVIRFIKPQPIYSLIKFHRHWTNQGIVIRADEFQLQQIFVNLFKNAAEATKRGVITISVNRIDQDRQVQLTISDNGPGMLPEFASRIFNFPISTKKNGHGLGLMIVKKLVGENQGTIQVASRVSRGTDFILTFPITSNKKEEGVRS